jgi:hypothetical protein
LELNGITSPAATTALGFFCFIGMTVALRKVWLGGRGRASAAAHAALALVAGFAVFVIQHGAELGIPIAFALASPAALGVVFLGRNAHQSGTEKPINRVTKARSQGEGDALRISAALLLPLLPSLSASAAFASVLPADDATRVVVAAYSLPIVWASFLAWGICAARLRPLFVSGAILTLSGLIAVFPFLGSGS